MKRAVHATTLLVMLALAGVARSEAPAPSLKLRVEAEGWNSEPADVRAVFKSVGEQLLPYFPGARVEPLHVTNGGGPITLYKREADGSIRIKLDTGRNFWAQCAFQFAHELTHVLCRYTETRHPNKWLEESICETGSLFTLRRMAEAWKTRPPYDNWKSYAPHLAEYAEKRIKEHALPPGTTLAAWYADNAEALRAKAEDRPRDTTVATSLLPLLEKSPEHWAAVHYLNQGTIGADESLAQCLARWHRQTPREHKAFVREVAGLFGVRIAGE